MMEKTGAAANNNELLLTSSEAKKRWGPGAWPIVCNLIVYSKYFVPKFLINFKKLLL